MANSDFYRIVQPGARNGGNAHMVNVMDGDLMPWALTPELVFSQVIKWTDLRDATGVLQTDELLIEGTIVPGDHTITFTDARTGVLLETLTHPVHEDTVTIGGTASDGNYDVIFELLDPPVRARVVRATTPASNDNIATAVAAAITDLVATDLSGIVASAAAVGSVVTIVYESGIPAQTLATAETTATGTIVATAADDEAAIATGLEALIEAARATTLAGYVDDESVASDTITVTYESGVQVIIGVDFPGTSEGTLTTTNVATITLGRTGAWFPSNVWVAGDRGAGQNVTTAFDGITTLTGELGGTFASGADVDGLMTASDMTVAGFSSTIAAAEYVEHMELAFEPTFTVTADGLFADLTAGELEVLIPYAAPPSI